MTTALTIEQALQLALQHHQAGQLPQAESLYRQILTLSPDHPNALHLLGLVLHQTRRPQEAEPLIRRAIAVLPNQPEFHSNLGNVLQDLSRFDEAITEYRSALNLKPDFPQALNNLGNALKSQGQLHEAKDAFQRSLQLNPQNPTAHNNLGNTHMALAEYELAVQCYQSAVTLAPQSSDFHNNLGGALQTLGRLDQAITEHKTAAALNPTSASAYNNLAYALQQSGQTDDALAACQRAIDFQPHHSGALQNLGNIYKDQGRIPQSLDAYRRAIASNPDSPTLYSQLLLTLHYSADHDPASILAEHRKWEDRFARPLFNHNPHANDRSPDRQLRVGYVSADFRTHPLARILLPIFQSHDRDRFQIICFSDVAVEDAQTHRLRALVDDWRQTAALTDEQLAQLIRQERIDILIDLTAHMSRSRLLAFARKPAPVQLAYGSYPATTGLSTIDYRITDRYLDPPGQTEQFNAEKLLHLNGCYWCVTTDDFDLEVNDLPALSTSQFTFASLNAAAKHSPNAIELWSRLLTAIPNSRLMLLIGEKSGHSSYLAEQFASHHIDLNRILMIPRRNRSDYLKLHHQIDLALDPFPYNGHTTSTDSFYMGVPVLTLPGQTSVSRGGSSLCHNLNLPDHIASTPDHFIQLAAEFASDLPRLSALRRTLRDRMKSSPLCDGPAQARDLERLYHQAWLHWCSKGGS